MKTIKFGIFETVCIGIVIIILFLMVLARELRYDTMIERAIEHGCARYHPQTGKFEWINKKESKR